MDKNEIVQRCIKRAIEYMSLIPQATEALRRFKMRYPERAAHSAAQRHRYLPLRK